MMGMNYAKDTPITVIDLDNSRYSRELVQKLGEPDWLYLAGNCRRVHDIVDSAAAEAEKIGREAALR